MDAFFNKHWIALQLFGGILATAITLTAYSYTTFQTKEDTQQALEHVEKTQALILNSIDKRLERIEKRLDKTQD